MNKISVDSFNQCPVFSVSSGDLWKLLSTPKHAGYKKMYNFFFQNKVNSVSVTHA